MTLNDRQRMSPSDPPRSKSKCPICKSEVEAGVDSYPFCSARCRKIDLGRWLDEQYLITRPIEQSDLDEGE